MSLKALHPLCVTPAEHVAWLMGKRATGPGVVGSGVFGLPPDLLARARGRVEWLALLMIGLHATAVVLTLFPAFRELFALESLGALRATEAFALVLGVALYLLSRDSRIGHGTVLAMALVYEVVLCLTVSVVVPWWIFSETGAVPHLTWATLVIIFFPMIVPTPPLQTLLASVAAAATVPGGLLVLDWLGHVPIQPGDYAFVSVSPVFGVGLAFFGSRIVYGMSVDVARLRRFGSYELDEPLGQGGMSEVWKARHRLLARPAAIKLLKPEVLAGSGREGAEVVRRRFEREAQAAASLVSPHTIVLYDYGISEDQRLYHVMELLEGFDADALVSRFGAVSPARAVHLLGGVCESLAEAHEAGLIHRDIKPANVFVCRYGRDVDHVKVLDFGLVKAKPSLDETQLQLTSRDVVGGTPAYMAPEQVLGTSPVDARTDIYAVGCLGYWLLTGHMVFDDGSVMKVLMDHVQTPPASPADRAPQAIPAELNRLVLDCLEKDPERRPHSADDLLDRLNACPMEEQWTQKDARAWWKAHWPPPSTTPGGATAEPSVQSSRD